jgi:hypothetical protein
MNHIKKTTEENKSWCGKELETGSFNFKDAEAAVINGLHGDLEVCGDCVDYIVENLIRRAIDGIE